MRYDAIVIKIGCTGGIAAGKSLFCSYMAGNGAAVIDADEVTHYLLNSDLALKTQLVNAFGGQILASDFSVSRPELAAVAFSSPDQKKTLESIVHPYLRKEILQRIERFALRKPPMLIIEGALLIETGAADFYGLRALIVVEAPLSAAAARLRESKKIGESDIEKRISVQSPGTERLKSGDFIIINSGDKNLLEKMARNVFDAVMKNCGLIPSDPPTHGQS